MHTRPPGSSAHTSASFNAAISIAAALLLGFAVGGIGIVTQVRMAPSAVPAEMAVSAQTDKQHRSLTASTHQSIKRTGSGPAWTALTAHQQQILAPLQNRWSSMSEITKRRWITLSEGFDQLSEADQNKLRKRMELWSSLSAQQRNQARLNFFNSRHHSADELQAKWEAYKALSEEEKQRLAAKAAPKPKGAAAALKPQSRKKLARVPAASSASPAAANLPKIQPPTAPAVPATKVPPAAAQPAAPDAAVRSNEVIVTHPVQTPQAAPAIALPPLNETAPVEQPSGTPNAGQYSHPNFPLVHPPQ